MANSNTLLLVVFACIGVVLHFLGAGLILTLNKGYFSTTLLPFDLDDVTINFPVMPDSVNGIGNIVAGVVIDILLVCLWLFIENRFNPSISRNHNKIKLILSIFVVLYGTVLLNLITNVIKHYRGGLRPHFIAACELNDTIVKEIRANGTSWVNLETTKIICTSTEKVEYRWSFPSGHTSQAFYGMVLAILIVNAWDKLWNRFPSALPIKGTIQFLFFSYANLVSFSRLVDYHHHWYDVLGGAVLGTVLAIPTHVWFLEPIMALDGNEKSAIVSDSKKVDTESS